MEPEEEDNHAAVPTDTSILDRKPLRVLGHPLTTTQQMWLGFMVPACISTIIFITSFALDTAVAYQLFRDGHSLLAGATIILMYAPSIVCLVLTFLNHPKLESVCEWTTWSAIQLLHCVMFPVGIMYRFATRLFWSVVALTEEDPERERALSIAAASHQTELFFLLDSFLNAAPQAVFQAYILLSPRIVTSNETAWTQAVSIVTSVIILSKTAALYQRFESQRVVGRSVPWTFRQNKDHTRDLVQIKKIDPYFLMGIHQENKPTTKLSLLISPVPEANQEGDGHIEETNQKTFEPDQDQNEAKSEEMEDVGERNTDIASEAQNQKGSAEAKEEPQEKDALLPSSAFNFPAQSAVPHTSSHYLEPIAAESVPLDDRCFWPRINTPPSSPTADPHMRPRLSINTIKTQNRPAYTSNIAIPLPYHKPRTKGLHEDEPLGILIVFNAWSAYLLGRVLVIASFSHFYLWPSLGLFLSHYAIMVTYISICNSCPNFWSLLLGLVYTLCPLEVKVRYKYPRIFLVLFFALVLLEDLSTVILWYCGADWESWWYDFAFAFILGCHGMAALNCALYLFMFKPKAKYVD